MFLSTYSIYTLLHLGGALGQNTATLLTCRLLSGIFGSSPLTNSGGTLADIWNARERGMATAIYATAPFLGVGAFFSDLIANHAEDISQPVVGPIVGGFVAEASDYFMHISHATD